jgi:hypothetical protein
MDDTIDLVSSSEDEAINLVSSDDEGEVPIYDIQREYHFHDRKILQAADSANDATFHQYYRHSI